MPIPAVAVDDPILADTMNSLIQNVNGSPYRAVFTASGSWTVPPGVQKYKVTLAGTGGTGGTSVTTGGSEGEYYINVGGPGGSAPMISAIFNAGAPGTTVSFTVGSTTSCNGLVSTAGGNGGGSGTPGGSGSATFPPGVPAVYHFNGIFCGSVGIGYGQGGPADSAGGPGAIIFEW